MTTTIVYVHGRSQEFKNPARLLTSWRAAMTAGLVKAGLPTLTGQPAVLPFYGNTLYEVTAQLERSPLDLESLEAGPLHPALSREIGTVERELMTDLAHESRSPAVREEGFFRDNAQRVLSWGGVRRALVAVARTANVDREVIKSQLKDVAVYLAGTGARERVLSVVRAALPPGELMLVTHSLGTVMGCDLLADAEIRNRTTAWLTLGSPLGLPTVQRNLLSKPFHNPGLPWLTGYDINDVVALGHPLRPSWHDPLIDQEVENGDAPHDIERYLSHPQVATFIAEHVTA